MAREQDLQNARARFAQSLSRLHDLSELSRRTLSTRDAELSTSRKTGNGGMLTLPQFDGLSISAARDILAHS